MPRRVIATAYDPRSIAVEEVDARAATPGRVVIAVHSAGVEPSDLKTVRGVFGDDPAKLPLRLGVEVAGVVTAVGEDDDGPSPFAVGDEVLASPVVGGWSDEVLVPVRNVLRRPPSLDPDAAAGLLVPGLAAWHLVEATAVGEGDRVVVHGASGSVGRIAVQLALLRGARVVGTASETNLAGVRELGADAVAHGPGLEERLRSVLPGGRADAALDAAGTDEALDASVVLVGDRTRVATVAGFARGGELGILTLGAGGDPGTETRRAAREPLVALAAEGRIRIRRGPVFPLERARDALEAVAAGRAIGRVVLHAAGSVDPSG